MLKPERRWRASWSAAGDGVITGADMGGNLTKLIAGGIFQASRF